MYYIKKVNSIAGELTLVADETTLVALLWGNDKPNRVKRPDFEWSQIERTNNNHPIFLEAERQLDDYFKGQLKNFNLPLDLIGTEFQKKVWQGLLSIPYGQTQSYQGLAKQIGHPKAMRALGAANGKNPILIIIPCHRVIGANGTLTGFVGGLKNKAVLLELEQQNSHLISQSKLSLAV